MSDFPESAVYLEDLRPGLELESLGRTISESDIVGFAGVSGDFNPIHMDAAFAKTTPFGERIAHGMLVASISTGLKSALDDWAMVAFLSTTRNFVSPVRIGDTVRIFYTVGACTPSRSGAPRGVVRLDLRVVNQDGVTVQDGADTILVAMRDQ